MVDSLAITIASPHTERTCGQSRGGGLVTSDSRRRSISFGRVAVTHVQGPPKGGGALGLLEVTSTRLTPVPPTTKEAPMGWKTMLVSFAIIAAAFQATPATAQYTPADDRICNHTDLTSAAAQLTRNWGERYQQKLVEQAAKEGWSRLGKVVEAQDSDIVCRITFSSVTSTLPARRIELRDIVFRYSPADGQIEAITLPMTGFDRRTSYAAIWERLFVDDQSLRDMMEKQAERDPAMAEAVAEIAGRPNGAENARWEPSTFCPTIHASTAAASIVQWAEQTDQVRSTGLTDKETPTWLPATDWKIGNFKVVSSIPFQRVICSADVTYTANTFSGQHIPMEIRGMSYRVWGNDDGSELYAEIHDWPTKAQQADSDNAFNRAWVVNGETFEQAWARKRQNSSSGGPKNIIDALNQQQAAYAKQVEALAREKGIPVDEMIAAENEETRKYAEPCRQSGGTWGWPVDQYGNPGRLGCYHPTGEQ